MPLAKQLKGRRRWQHVVMGRFPCRVCFEDSSWVEAIASRLEAMAFGLEAIATRVEAIDPS